jgi:hypothetical protein
MASRALRLSHRANVAGFVRAEASHRRLDSCHRPTAGNQHSLSEAALAHHLLRFGFYLHWAFHDSNRERSSVFAHADFSLPGGMFRLGVLGNRGSPPAPATARRVHARSATVGQARPLAHGPDHHASPRNRRHCERFCSCIPRVFVAGTCSQAAHFVLRRRPVRMAAVADPRVGSQRRVLLTDRVRP